MKLLTFIWVILILALACFPCMDGSKAYAQGNATTVQANTFHHDEAQCEDLCVSLCDCSCCGVLKIAIRGPQLIDEQPLQQDLYLSIYLEPGAATPTFPFWHPPRV